MGWWIFWIVVLAILVNALHDGRPGADVPPAGDHYSRAEVSCEPSFLHKPYDGDDCVPRNLDAESPAR